MKAIEHTRTKARHPQTNDICERFHKTVLQEFYQVAFRRKLHHSLEELQTDLDVWLDHYNTERTHQGKMCRARTPMQTQLDGKRLWEDKVGQLNSSARENHQDGANCQIKSKLLHFPGVWRQVLVVNEQAFPECSSDYRFWATSPPGRAAMREQGVPLIFRASGFRNTGRNRSQGAPG